VLSQADGGRGAALNFGIMQSRGRYVLPLSPEAVLEPAFVQRCVEVLEADPDLAYVSAWDRDARPIGNWTAIVEEERDLAGVVAVLRRSVFDHHHFSDEIAHDHEWTLFRALHRAGRHGLVIPEVLHMRRAREREGGDGELDAALLADAMAWVP
jgi:hypothetical protein